MIRKLLMLISLPAFIYTADASAQYYEIANQIGNLITPALSGGMNYKGFVEAEYLHGLGDYQCDFACLSTVQGFGYSDWFFMGAGLGVQYVHTSQADGWGTDFKPGYATHSSADNGVMIPVFTDFRFNIGGRSGIAFLQMCGSAHLFLSAMTICASTTDISPITNISICARR